MADLTFRKSIEDGEESYEVLVMSKGGLRLGHLGRIGISAENELPLFYPDATKAIRPDEVRQIFRKMTSLQK